jgi:cytochrome c oxidase subunit II
MTIKVDFGKLLGWANASAQQCQPGEMKAEEKAQPVISGAQSLPEERERRVLIASSHPLFGQGLLRLLKRRQEAGVQVVGMVSTLDEALAALERLDPDLIIVDYDDEKLNRDEFLARFVEGEKKLRVVLLSLQSAGEALVYDRRTLSAYEIDDWLEEWTTPEEAPAAGRTSSGMSEAQQNGNRRMNSMMKHLVIAGILVIAITALLILGGSQIRLLPDQASRQAESIDWLFNLELMVIAFLFSLIVVLMVYSIVVFRRKAGDDTDAPHIEGSSRLEVLWTLGPLATVLVFAYLGGVSLAETVRAEPHALEINVIGRQWSWSFEYPEFGIVSDRLVMPLDRQALLRLSSTDVIHSFWVPEFRVKQDVLPGGEQFIRELRVTPKEAGTYQLICAELCGIQHTTMKAEVEVISETDFEAWIDANSQVSDDPVERGQQFAQQSGCFACHSVDGSPMLGPTWLGIFGTEREMQDGTVVVADEQYLFDSIRHPGDMVVAGFANVMPPNIADNLTDEQVTDIILFIESLR